MSEYFDYVLTVDKFNSICVYKAPGFSCFKPGDELIVEGASMPVSVIDSIIVATDSKIEHFLLSLLQGEPNKVLQQISYKNMEWEN